MSENVVDVTAALNLDSKQQSAFINFYNKLPEKPTATLRFFNHTDFYSLHGDDATLGSQFVNTPIKKMASTLNYITLKKAEFEKYIRELLLVKQYRIEVYFRSSNNYSEWRLEYNASPGNLSQFEDILFDNTSITTNNYVMALKIARNNTIAAAAVNSTELKFELSELADNDSHTELEALIAQIGPRECLIPAGDSPEIGQLQKVLERNGVLVAKVKRGDFGRHDDVLHDLNRLLYFREGQQRNASSFVETKLMEAVACLGAVIKFLNLMGAEQNFNQWKIGAVDVNRYVRMDNAALYSLNILPKVDAGTKENASFSVKGILDNCSTAQGRRLLDQWIKQPLKDLHLLEERLNIVESLVKNPQIRQSLSTEILPRLPDMLFLSKKLSSKKANLQDCYKIYQILTAIPTLLDALKQIENPRIKPLIYDPIDDSFAELSKYVAMIEEILDLDMVDRGEFLVKKSFDPELAEIYATKDEIEEKMQKELKNATKELGMETIKLESNDQVGFFFRVTLKEEHFLRNSKKFKILGAIKGGVRFTNKRLDDLNDDYTATKKAYEAQQNSVINDIFEVAAGYGDSLRHLNVLIAKIDVLTSFSVVSINAKIPYTKPVLHPQGNGILNLRKARHPCIEAQDHISFIPNDVGFKANENELFIITGPNMCGKSTYIRSVGVCVLMAQIGCFVPCDSAEIALVDAILARVGAEDCQEKGLSTFMLEMIETATIVKTASKDSLVIIDELGRGTSTYDGCGLAYAIAEHLAKELRCFTLFATHFNEITKLGEQYSTVNNLHVTAVTTDNTITPLYQIQKGECDNSYGVHCAKMADFPNDVIKAAREHQSKLEHTAGMQLIKDFDPEIKRQIIQEGDVILEQTINKIKSSSLVQMSDDEIMAYWGNLKSDLIQSNNLFVKGFFS